MKALKDQVLVFMLLFCFGSVFAASQQESKAPPIKALQPEFKVPPIRGLINNAYCNHIITGFDPVVLMDDALNPGYLFVEGSIIITPQPFCRLVGFIEVGESVEINAQFFTAKDVFLSASKIIIKTEKFDFTGTIECDTYCTIVTEKPIDIGAFCFKGNGVLEIKMEQYDIHWIENSTDIFGDRLDTPPTQFGNRSKIPSTPDIFGDRLNTPPAPYFSDDSLNSSSTS